MNQEESNKNEHENFVKIAYDNASEAILEFQTLLDEDANAQILEHMFENVQDQLREIAIQVLKFCPCCGEEAVPVDVVHENETQTIEILPCVFELDSDEGMLRFNMYGDNGELMEITGWEELPLLLQDGDHKEFEVAGGIVTLLRSMADQIERKNKATKS